MKILRLRLRNLNSLQGPWKIDFTAPPLSHTGLFAITGPTGAGKSTILDAITLALYGRAARYANDAPTEMMSRHTADCMAEVDFAARDQEYSAHWSISTTKSGNQKPSRRVLSKLPSGEILHEKAKDIDDAVERLTGLDLQRFLRSVLLAQGQFNAFLRAPDKERSALLEKITGTEIYSELSVLAHDLASTRRREVEKLRNVLAEISSLTDEQRTALEKELEDLQQKTEATTQRWHMAQQRRVAAETAEQAAREVQQWAAKAAEFQPKLQAAEKILAQFLAAEQNAKAALEAAQPELQAARAWDAKLAIFESKVKSAALDEKAATEAHQKAELGARKSREALRKAEKCAAEAESWLRENAAGAVLTERLDLFREKLTAWQEADLQVQRHAKLKLETTRLAAKLQEISNEQAACAKKASEQREVMLKCEGDLKADEAQLKNIEERLERAKAILSLEDHRRDLVPGQECPLCGSKEHPWASKNVNRIAGERDKLAKEREEIVARITKHKEAHRIAERHRDEAEHTAKMLKKSSAEMVRQLEEIAQEFQLPTAASIVEIAAQAAALAERATHRLEISKSEAVKLFQEWDEAPHDFAESQAALRRLESKAKTWREKKDAAQKSAIVTEQQRGVANLAAKEWETAAATLEKAAAAHQVALAESAAALAERKKLFGGKSCEEVEAEFSAKIRAASQQIEESRQAIATLQRSIQEAAARRAAAEAALAAARERWESGAEAGVSVKFPPDAATLKALREAESAVDAERNELNQRIGSLRQSLEEDDRKRGVLKERKAQLLAAESAAERWNRLADLIGSANGALFGKFAQGLTLERLLLLANRHLQKLNPRYQLRKAEDSDLALEIIDLFQGSVRRPMASLSGGESFLTSLALALGVSELASRHARIDSLFIDEGFGSLDSGALEIALDALENLQARGKMIGVISHVELLKERITTQVVVEKRSDGTSRINIIG